MQKSNKSVTNIIVSLQELSCFYLKGKSLLFIVICIHDKIMFMKKVMLGVSLYPEQETLEEIDAY